MKLTQLLILFLFLSIKGFSQQAVLTSSGDKVTLNYLSSSGGTITGSITVNGATTLSGTLTIGDKLFPTSFGSNGDALTISGTNMVWAASSGIPYTGATQAVNLGSYDLAVNGLTIGQGNSNIGTNTVMGNGSLSVNTSGQKNTAMGYTSLFDNTAGFENTAVGYEAMKLNTTGNYNTAIGMIALSKNTTGTLNTAIGYNSLGNNSTGDGNIAIGKYAGQYNTTGNNNTIIGTDADVPSGSNLSNATAIGYQASVTASNTITLGNGAITNVNTSGSITANGVTLTSDLRLKRNIKPISKSIDQILKLNPVSYDKKQNLNSSEYSIKENGFIAHELRKVFPDLVKEGTDKDKLLSVNYTALIPVLTKSIQEQQKQIQEQNKKIEKLQALVEQLINKKK